MRRSSDDADPDTDAGDVPGDDDGGRADPVRDGRETDGDPADGRSRHEPRSDGGTEAVGSFALTGGLDRSPAGSTLDRLRAETDRLSDADDRASAAGVLFQAVRGLLDAPGVGVFLVDEDENRLRPVEITDALVEYYGGACVFGPGMPDSLTWSTFVGGESRYLADVGSARGRVNEETDAGAAAFVPLGDHGVLVVATDRTAEVAPGARNALELLATAATSTLDRIGLASDGREFERQLATQRGRLARRKRLDDLSWSILDAAMAADSREEIERAVCRLLADDDRVGFAWIGGYDPEAATLEPRQWTEAGSQYLDDVSLSTAGSAEPTCRAARSRTVTRVSNVARSIGDDGWERAALARDFHAAVAVPVERDGVLYGILGVYATRPGAFDDPTTEVLGRLGRAVAFAVSAVETREAVTATERTELELRIEPEDDALTCLADSVDVSVTCLGVDPTPADGTTLLVSVSGAPPATVRDAAADSVAVTALTHLGGDEAHLFRVTVTAESVPAVVARLGAIPSEAVAEDGVVVVTADLPATTDARTFVGRLRQRYPDTQLVARRDRDRAADTRSGFLDELEAVLTDRQLEVLRTAHELGFFGSPREATGEDVAAALGVSQPTISHHLRSAQGRLFSMLFDGSDAGVR